MKLKKSGNIAPLWIDDSRKALFNGLDHLCYWDAPGAIFGCAGAQYQATRSCTHDIGRSGTEEEDEPGGDPVTSPAGARNHILGLNLKIFVCLWGV